MEQAMSGIAALLALAMGTVGPERSDWQGAVEPEASVSEATVQCGPERWVGEPGMRADRFVGAMTSECEAALAGSRGDVGRLQDRLSDATLRENEIHAGPIEETYEGLPSVRFDLTSRRTELGESLVLRLDLHLASDDLSRLVFDSLSTKIEGGGNAQYLKRLDTRMAVDRASDDGRFRFAMTNAVEVEKPWYAPTGIFVSKLKEGLREQYLSRRNAWVNQLADQLAR